MSQDAVRIFRTAPAEVSGRVRFLDRAKGLDVPRQVKGPVDHRDQGSDGDADQAEFQDKGDCGHEGKDSFDNRLTTLLENLLYVGDVDVFNFI